jgi:hypothetical protein
MSGSDKPLSPLEVATLRIKAASTLLAALDEYKSLGGELTAEIASTLSGQDISLKDRLARLPLGEAVVEYLKTCRKPQTTRQILVALNKAGREFDSTTKPFRAVKDALKKAATKNDDLIHIRWARWHLKSKYRTKAALDKILAPNATFGTGGRTSTAHGKRTRDGMKQARASGKQIGAVLKMTDDKIALIRRLILEGKTASEASREAGISAQLFFLYRSKPNGPFSDLTLRKGRKPSPASDSAPMLRVVK